MPPLLNCVLCRLIAGLAIYVMARIFRNGD